MGKALETQTPSWSYILVRDGWGGVGWGRNSRTSDSNVAKKKVFLNIISFHSLMQTENNKEKHKFLL